MKRECLIIIICISFITLLFTACENGGGSDLGDKAQILEFKIAELPEVNFSVDHSNGFIEISNHQDLPAEYDVTNLTGEFETSKGASVFIDERSQISGETTNDFSEGVFYTVISENHTSQSTYFVHLERELPLSYLITELPVAEYNPSGRAPLTAEIELETREPTYTSIKVLGDIPIEKSFSNPQEFHSIPVLGLYADMENQVALSVTNAAGHTVRDTISIETEALPDFLPTPQIDVLNQAKMEPGMHFSEVHIGNAGTFNSYPLIFDNNGDIRWYVDLSELGKIAWPVKFNEDNTFYLANGVTIYEYNMLGSELNRIIMEGHYVHHEVLKIPNGNYVVAVSKQGTPMIKDGEEMESVEDYIIEVDPSGNIVTEWDMAEVLDVDRTTLTDGGVDWFHMNAIWHDKSDNSLIISGRNQGIVKVNWENELQWILAPHKGWGKAGRYEKTEETAPYLLTAVDDNGQAFSEEVQLGEIESYDFSWTWGQHTPMLLPNGNLFVFDNGYNRNFGNSSSYSLGTEYEIDEENMTVKEVWSYGRSRGNKLFSNIISDVDHLPETSNRLFMPGVINTTSQSHSKMVEMSYPNKQVVFEARLNFKNALVNGQGWGNLDITYRGERVSLYRNITSASEKR